MRNSNDYAGVGGGGRDLVAREEVVEGAGGREGGVAKDRGARRLIFSRSDIGFDSSVG